MHSMRSCIRTSALLAAVVSCAGALAAPAALAAGPALSPSAYTVSRLCAQPSPGHAGCLGLRLVAKAPLSVPHARALRAPTSGGAGSPATEFTEPIPASVTPGNLLGIGLDQVPAQLRYRSQCCRNSGPRHTVAAVPGASQQAAGSRPAAGCVNTAPRDSPLEL